MACTFHIREPYERPYIVPGDEDSARPGDISLDFDVPFDTDADRSKATLDRIESNLKLIKKVEVKPGLKSVYKYPSIGWALTAFGALLLYLFYYVARLLYYHHHDRPFLSVALAAAWTVGVPIYFYLEHEVAFFYFGDPPQYEQFKRVQDLAAKIWAGAIAVLGAILADKWITG